MTHACVKATIGAVGSSALLGLDAPQTSAWGPPSVRPHQDGHGPPARAGLLAPRWRLGTPEPRRLHQPGTLPDPHARVLTTEHAARARATCHALPWTAALARDAVRTQDATLPVARGRWALWATRGRREPWPLSGAATQVARDPRAPWVALGPARGSARGLWRHRRCDHTAWGTPRRAGARSRHAQGRRRGYQGPCTPPTMTRRGRRRQALTARWGEGEGVGRSGPRPLADPPPWEDACRRAHQGV